MCKKCCQCFLNITYFTVLGKTVANILCFIKENVGKFNKTYFLINTQDKKISNLYFQYQLL